MIRGQKVMLDTDLADLYQAPTFRLNEQVKRNRNRFPPHFMFQLFQLTKEEAKSLTSQFARSKEGRGGRRTLPYVFTEQGVAMLSTVLNSDRAIQVNIVIMRAFVKLRELLSSHKEVLQKLDQLERKYERHDAQIKVVFDAIRKHPHQIVGTAFDRRISRSAVTRGIPSASAVAPIIRSAGSFG